MNDDDDDKKTHIVKIGTSEYKEEKYKEEEEGHGR